MPDEYRNKVKAALVAAAGLLGGVLGLPFGEEDAEAGTAAVDSVYVSGAAFYAAAAGVVVWGKAIFDKIRGQ